MAAPTTLLWDRDPHTEAKHAMLSHYLNAWFPIIASRWASTGATFADAFAGPGEYTDGAAGSPIIALRAANRTDVARHPTTLRMVLVEKDGRRLQHLLGLIDRLHLRRSGVEITPVHGTCETDLLPALDRVAALDGPMFVNLDGWGVDTPYAVVERVGAGRSAEVLITFEAQWFTRFANLDDVAAGDRVFGETGWRAVAKELNPSAKKHFLVERYRNRLRDAGFPYALTFEMIDEGGHALFLVFGTGNPLGVEKMKDAMWRVDKVGGQRFRDPRDVNQLTFELVDSDPDLTLLKRQLLDQLDSGATTLAALKEFALIETIFKATHVDPAIRDLERRHKVERGSARSHEDVSVRLAPPSLFDS
jgi:three-Cys-motif partner protein